MTVSLADPPMADKTVLEVKDAAKESTPAARPKPAANPVFIGKILTKLLQSHDFDYC